MGDTITTHTIRERLARERLYLAAARISALAEIDRSPEAPICDGDNPDQETLRSQEMLADVLEALAQVLCDASWHPEPDAAPRNSHRLTSLFRRPSPDQEVRC